jgi:hypothetical protein
MTMARIELVRPLLLVLTAIRDLCIPIAKISSKKPMRTAGMRVSSYHCTE